MLLILLTVLIYLIGTILSYFSLKFYHREIEEKKWTVEDRLLTIFISLFSWLLLFLDPKIFWKVISKKFNFENEAKW